MSILLGFIGAWLGNSTSFALGAAIGWFVGSTIGTLLSLEGSHTSTTSGRITDFKMFNSKHGIAIHRGYGAFRYSGNMIWASPVQETLTSSTDCIKQGGFLGLGSTRVCTTVNTYNYRQSAAIAFCEGEACLIRKIWADGTLVWYSGTDRTQKVRTIVSDGGVNPYNCETQSPIRIYLGTLTQNIDPLIKKWLGPTNSESGLDEAYAFRSIVYIMVDGLDIREYGNRFPTFTAEVCFSCNDERVDYGLERPTILPDSEVGEPGWVAGHPFLYVGCEDATTGRRALWDVRDGTLLFEGVGGVGDLTSSRGTNVLSPQLFGFRVYYPFGNISYAGPYDFISNKQLYIRKRNLADHSSNLHVAYDCVRHAFWSTSNVSGDMDYWPLYSEDGISEIPDETDTEASIGPWGYSFPLIPTRTLSYSENKDFESGGEEGGFLYRGGRNHPEDAEFSTNLADRGGNIQISKNGEVLWTASNSSRNTFTFFHVAKRYDSELGYSYPSQVVFRMRYHDGTPLEAVAGSAYVADDDSMIFEPDDTPNATLYPNGIYKVFLSELDYDANEVLLPNYTDPGRYIHPVINGDSSAWQRGPHNGLMRFRTASPAASYKTIDVINMELVESVSGLRSPWSQNILNAQSVYFPAINGTVFEQYQVSLWGAANDVVPLSEIVEDLMTKTDGDQRPRLLPSDIDVTELATTFVRGFGITRQQTIRASITQLMQAFFFDAVESDGILKFRKRGQTPSFTLLENDLAAKPYGELKSASDALQFERRGELELPRELSIVYPDVNLDYLQETQKVRRLQTDSDSNMSLSFQIVFTGEEALGVAHVLLADAWQERQSGFSCTVSTKNILIEPGDTGTIVKNDGTVYRVRVINAVIGANQTIELSAVEEFENTYTANVTGAGIETPTNLIPDNDIEENNTIPILLPVGGRALQRPLETNGVTMAVGGIAAYSYFDYPGGKLFTGDTYQGIKLSGVANRGISNAVTWGTSNEEIGHPNNYIATNVLDTETVITLSLLGGTPPVSGTLAQALNGERLMIIDEEVIGYTTVSAPEDVSVTGTDISFDSGANTIDSTSTDFVAAGFLASMQLWITAGSPEAYGKTFKWTISSVTTNQLVMDNVSTSQIAGVEVTIQEAGRNYQISGLLRGLYGTHTKTYHRAGSRVYMADNLFPAPVDPPRNGYIVYGYSEPLFGGPKVTTTLRWGNANLRPWPPLNVRNIAKPFGTSFTWDRMDKVYSDGIDPALPSDPDENSEVMSAWPSNEQYLVRDISYNAPVASTTPGALTFRVNDYEVCFERFTQDILPTSIPKIIEVQQRGYLADGSTLIHSYPFREIITSGSLTGGGAITDALDKTPRWNHETPLVYQAIGGAGGFSATTALQLKGDELAGIEFDLAGGCVNIEVLARFYPSDSGLGFNTRCGIFLRGVGKNSTTGGEADSVLDISSGLIGFAGASADDFVIDFVQRGASGAAGISPTYDDQVSYDWSRTASEHDRRHWVRARWFKNRVQAKVWENTDPEPTNWMLDCYDDNFGPYFGACGIFARGATNYCDYFSWAHRGETAL